jgi:lipopolysaccharide export LptBFGC system permease protein LptF
MDRSQRTGLIIMIASAFAAVFFLWSILRRSYMAIALPVMSAIAAVSALAFWIGWTMFTAESEELEELEEELAEEVASERV